jgi:hypothetical protein
MRHRRLRSLNAVPKAKKPLEIKNQPHCQGALKVPGRRIWPWDGLYSSEPPTKQRASREGFKQVFALAEGALTDA